MLPCCVAGQGPFPIQVSLRTCSRNGQGRRSGEIPPAVKCLVDWEALDEWPTLPELPLPHWQNGRPDIKAESPDARGAGCGHEYVQWTLSRYPPPALHLSPASEVTAAPCLSSAKWKSCPPRAPSFQCLLPFVGYGKLALLSPDGTHSDTIHSNAPQGTRLS